MKVALPLEIFFCTIRKSRSSSDTGIQKKIHSSGTTTLITSNEEMNDIMKIVPPLEDSGILLKGIPKTVENEIRDQKVRFIGIYVLLDAFSASLLKKIDR